MVGRAAKPGHRMAGGLIGMVCWSFATAGMAAPMLQELDAQGRRETLRGLQGMRIVVEALSPDLEGAGLPQRQLQANIEQRLRRAGVRVLTPAAWRMTPGTPWLYVRVSALRTETGAYAYSVDVAVKQEVIPTHNPYIKTPLVDAVTWQTGRIGYTGTATVQPIRQQVEECVDTFIRAYLAVNPPICGEAEDRNG